MGRDLVRRLIRMARPSPRADLEALVRGMVSRRLTRGWLNFVYNRLSPARKETFYSLFAKTFRDHPRPVVEGEWWVDLAGRWAAMPLGGRDIWLEWDLAVSILGHEVEVKQTYLNLIRLRPPKLCFDVGANYGLHSLFFLMHGLPTVSFEPNPRCHEYFRKLVKRNNLTCEIQHVALGATEDSVEICFPERDTWLGSTNSAIADQLIEAHGPVTRLRVPQTTLDAFTQRDGREPGLIKIDTEGNEELILQGARNTLAACRPWVIFESWRERGRENLFALFEGLDYKVCGLPLEFPRRPMVLDRTRFLGWPDTNLAALPGEDLLRQERARKTFPGL